MNSYHKMKIDCELHSIPKELREYVAKYYKYVPPNTDREYHCVECGIKTYRGCLICHNCSTWCDKLINWFQSWEFISPFKR